MHNEVMMTERLLKVDNHSKTKINAKEYREKSWELENDSAT